MALKPPPIGEVMQQVGELVGPAGLVEEVDRNARQQPRHPVAVVAVDRPGRIDADVEQLPGLVTVLAFVTDPDGYEVEILERSEAEILDES